MTRSPRGSWTFPVPEPEPSGPVAGTEGLIRPAGAIFDAARVGEELGALPDCGGGEPALRRGAVDVLSRALADGRRSVAEAFADDPLAARALTRSCTFLVDGVVRSALLFSRDVAHRNPTPTEGERLSLLAVGGHGRGELAPHSDVDLLFLTPWKVTPWAESVVESALYILWDLRLKVGHATRTVKDCLNLGREDLTIRTALLEARPLEGDADLARELDERLKSELFRGTESEFVEGKLRERAERHGRRGGRRYLLEPNVKEGKGGLRDLQSLFWIAKYVHHVDSVAALRSLGVFRDEEYAAFAAAENFLWAARAHLHLATGRAMDQLTFDLQVEVARRMGYADHGGRRGVEHFMQDYFRHAKRVGELTRIFLTALEADNVKKTPSLTRLLRRRKKPREPYAYRQNRLDVADAEAFLADKLNLLRIFEEALRTGAFLHPDALRLVAANLSLIDDGMRGDREAARIFLDILLKHGNPERGLRRMNEIGVLAAFLPEFEPIVAMMQFNMYHHYTLDEHTIECVSILAKIERGELTEELPVASRILEGGVDRKVIYVALLLHDIGKGRPEDHSVVGARIARGVCPRLGLNEEQCETVEWLVRHHLLMSDMAQKRDISDPRTVRDFAKAVKTRKRLDLLTVLTVCDIRGVGPGTWNNWKAQLLRSLYAVTAEGLEKGLEDLNRETYEKDAKKALREALSDWSRADVRREIGRHHGAYWQGLRTETHVAFARMLRDSGGSGIGVELTMDGDRDATRALFAMADHPGVFSRFAGALALVGANVVDARTHTTKDGHATAAFWVQDASGNPYGEERLDRLKKMIHGALEDGTAAREALKDRDRIKKRESEFRVPTTITFDNEGSEIHTIVEVDTRDRPGLLYDLTRTLAASNVSISSAVIATYGAQAVDTFYVKDAFGLKLHSGNRRRNLEEKLRVAIASGAEWAKR